MKLHLIDAFADGPFTGNPAGVVLLDGARPEAWMQQVAMEMNQAETAFLAHQDDGFGLRWFTPNKEVDLCGHATLASAHFLWETGALAAGAVARFHTRNGLLTARRNNDGSITLDFPAIARRAAAPPDDLALGLGVSPLEVWDGDYDLLCVLDSAARVRSLKPDFARIARWNGRGVLVTAPGDRDGVDFVSRCFFPAYGIPEDPVTGSAHCALAVHWSTVFGRGDLVGYQASPRGGTVRCKVVDDRVELTGKAVTTVTGTLQV